METKTLSPNANGFFQAAKLLQAGSLVAFPTETVYGLGADAYNSIAVAKVYAAKGRPNFNPLIVHVIDLETAQKFAEFNAQALYLAKEFWPGPLTIIVPLKPKSGLSKLVTAGLNTVAIRIPSHPVARELLTAFGGPVAAPSANPSGSISATTASHVRNGLNGRINAVLNGGKCNIGLESTIIMPKDGKCYILRSGGVPVDDIEVLIGSRALSQQDPLSPKSPGQLASHYAPKAQLRMNVNTALEDEYMIGFGDITGQINLSTCGDLVEAASNLFAYLHMADEDAATLRKTKIAVAPIPMNGLGAAINDRLQRASTPKV